MSHTTRAKRGKPGGLTRREAMLAGFAMVGGGFTIQGILSLGFGKSPPSAEAELDALLAMPDLDLLCLADSLLDRPLQVHRGDKARRLLLRILAAALDVPSDENDLLAARVVSLLGRSGWISPAVTTLVREGRAAPAARAALEKALSRKEGS